MQSKKLIVWRKYVLLGVKVLVTTVPVYVLVKGERFDFSQQADALKDFGFVGSLFLLWVLSFVLLIAFRWQKVSKIFNLDLPFLFATKAHSAAVFLSAWLPGGIGGDLWKAYRFGKQFNTQAEKHLAYLSVLFDRVIGLYAIVLCGACAVILNAELWLELEYNYLAIMLVVLFVLMTGAGLVLVFLPMLLPRGLLRMLKQACRRWGFLEAIVETIVLARKKRALMTTSLVLSIVIQLLNVYILYIVTVGVTGQSVGFGMMTSIFAISLLITVLSLAPGGIGVGHYMFDMMFSELGFTGGADVFNFFLIVTVIFSLIGTVPFLFFERKILQGIATMLRIKDSN